MFSYKQRAWKFETNSFQSVTRSHGSWFITNVWKSDLRLNMTLCTDKKFTSSFLSANHCVDENEFCLIARLKSFEARIIQMGGAYLVTRTVLYVLSVSHTSVTSTFQGQPLLSNSCWTASFCSPCMPHEAPPLCPMHKFSQSEGIASLREPKL